MSSGDTGTDSPGPEGTDGKAQTTNGKMTKKPVSVTELELQFAQNPDSDAYIDLCEAYLDQGRFMEAMVVCKKGIKAHPDSVDAKILLAKVYSRQKKYKRALTELDELAGQKPNDAKVYLARGMVKDESSDEAGAVADLKKAIDLDNTLEEATAILKAKGITYPEEVKAPPPPPPAEPAPVSHRPGRADLQAAISAAKQPRGVKAESARPHGGPPPPPTSEPDTNDVSSQDIVTRSPPPPPSIRAQSFARADQRVHHGPQLLDQGEEELERIARKVAEEKPDQGKPKTTFALIIALAIIGLFTIVTVFLNKRKVEMVDQLTAKSIKSFNRDTYSAYKEAADSLEEIIKEWDSDHPLTAARLAHTYSILWSEHGETDLEPKLKEAIALAKKEAPEVSHTIAAEAIYSLYSGPDRQIAAKGAFEQLSAVVKKLEGAGAGPSHADLALGIIELELGDYDAATRTLSKVTQAMPESTLAKVWHARAAFRAKRLASSLTSFETALRQEPNHPSALAGLALVHLELGGLGSAGEDLLKFDDFAEKHPKEISRRDAALAEFARSELFRYAGEEQKAGGAYENAVRLNPKNADFPFGLGRWLLKNERKKEAIPHLRKAVEMEPTRWTFLLELGDAEMQEGDYRGASQHIEEAIKRAPDRSEPLVKKAALLRRQGDSNTESFIKDAIAKKPTAKVPLNVELGRFYRKQGRLDEAKAIFEKEVIDSMGGYAQLDQADWLVSYGLLVEQLGDKATALNVFQKAADFGSLEGSFHVARSLVSTDKVKAKAACERVLGAGYSSVYDDAQKICAPFK
jgi:cellulose synthase operon protein C